MNSMPRPRARCRSRKQVDDLRPHRDVERGDRLVGDQEVGVGADGARDHRALALAAGEFVRIAGGIAGHEARLFAAHRARAPARRVRSQPCTRRCSVSVAPIVMRGLSAPDGSWNTSCRRRRSWRSAAAGDGRRVLAVEAHRAVRRRLQADQRAAERRFAAAALADQAERLAARDRDVRRRPARAARGPRTR